MATLSVSAGDYIQPYRGGARCNAAPEGASQSFTLGALLKFSATAGAENQVIVCGADPSVLMGVAASAASGVQTTPMNYWIPEPDVEFIGRCQDGGTTDFTNVGTAYGVVFDATNNIWRVDLSETGTTSVVVTALIADPVTGSFENVNGQLAFQFKAAARVPFNG